jgi:hypothetical protein
LVFLGLVFLFDRLNPGINLKEYFLPVLLIVMGLVFVLFILEFDAFLAWKFVFLLDLI